LLGEVSATPRVAEYGRAVTAADEFGVEQLTYIGRLEGRSTA
jgi:hypothetical protein